MDVKQEVINVKRDFITNMLQYENSLFIGAIGFLAGFLINASINKSFDLGTFLCWLLIGAIGLLLGEAILENLRVKKYNELKYEIENNLLHRPIKTGLY